MSSVSELDLRAAYDAHMSQARSLRQAGDHGAAAEFYAQAAALNPHSQAGLFQAIALRDAGQVDQAIAAYQAYVKTNPQDSGGWSGLGITYKRLGRYDEAVAPLRRALQVRDDPAVRNVLVGVLYRAKKLSEARDEGMKNLILKDRLAHEAFVQSPYGGGALKAGGRGFDPEKRERNIISFSLWGDRPEYVTGAIVNAQIAQHLYVRWTPRFYCDTSVPQDARDALTAYGAQVILMTDKADAAIRPMWRFLVSDDRDVNVFVCRDTDSRLNAKELLGVSDWLNSGKRFHVMRDHIYHHELILAGMWGGTAGVLPDMREGLRAASQYFDNKFGDQAFLADMVWPLIRQDTKVHDTVYGFPDAGGFPAGYDLPGLIHVGGGVKTMPHWSKYVHLPQN